jgi:WD40 repeat protein
MMRINVRGLRAIRTPASVGLLVTTLVAGTAAEVLAQTSGTWSKTGSMKHARARHTATLLQNGQVLVAGGYNGNGLIYATAELYNPVTGTWTATGTMSTARVYHTATLLPNGKVLVAGGENNNSNALSSAELYDPSTGTWTLTGSMKQVRAGFTATLLTNGHVLAAGSGNSGNAELYNPATGTWTLTGSLNYYRAFQFAMMLANGEVLVLDGGVSLAEFYNPSTGIWSLDGGGNGLGGSTGQTVTLLGTGMVLSAGGSRSTPYGIAVFSQANLFDPSTGNDVMTGSMKVRRRFHTATLLPNGQLLAAGGQSQTSALFITNTAELYTS